MICFGLDGTEEQHYELLSHLKMIVHAVSLGDGESLIVYNSKNGEKKWNCIQKYSEKDSIDLALV